MGDSEVGVFPHVLADAGKVLEAGNVVFSEVGAGTDAADHEELGGLDSSRGEDDFSASGEGEIEGGGSECAGCESANTDCRHVGVEEDLLG